MLPAFFAGITSCQLSPPSSAISRCLNQGMHDGSSPAAFWRTSHGPSFARRAHRPVRMRSASPAETFTPAGELDGRGGHDDAEKAGNEIEMTFDELALVPLSEADLADPGDGVHGFILNPL